MPHNVKTHSSVQLCQLKLCSAVYPGFFLASFAFDDMPARASGVSMSYAEAPRRSPKA